VLFEVRGYPERLFEAFITAIAPAADPVTRQIGFLVEIPNDEGQLVAGLFAEGRLTTSRREVLTVPMAAVNDRGEVSTVDRIADGVVERVPILLGERDPRSELVEVLEGLEAGDLLVLRTVTPVPPGTPVAVPDVFGTRPPM